MQKRIIFGWSWLLVLGVLLTAVGSYNIIVSFLRGRATVDNTFLAFIVLAIGLISLALFARRVRRLRRFLSASMDELATHQTKSNNENQQGEQTKR